MSVLFKCKYIPNINLLKWFMERGVRRVETGCGNSMQEQWREKEKQKRGPISRPSPPRLQWERREQQVYFEAFIILWICSLQLCPPQNCSWVIFSVTAADNFCRLPRHLTWWQILSRVTQSQMEQYWCVCCDKETCWQLVLVTKSCLSHSRCHMADVLSVSVIMNLGQLVNVKQQDYAQRHLKVCMLSTLVLCGIIR